VTAAGTATAAATVNCHAVSDATSDPSLNRRAAIVYRAALNTPAAISRSPVTELCPPSPLPARASTSRPATATATAPAAAGVTRSRSSSPASVTTSADSRPVITAPDTALVIASPAVSARYATAGSSRPSRTGSHQRRGGR
jgi:hypothetical protein